MGRISGRRLRHERDTECPVCGGWYWSGALTRHIRTEARAERRYDGVRRRERERDYVRTWRDRNTRVTLGSRHLDYVRTHDPDWD